MVPDVVADVMASDGASDSDAQNGLRENSQSIVTKDDASETNGAEISDGEGSESGAPGVKLSESDKSRIGETDPYSEPTDKGPSAPERAKDSKEGEGEEEEGDLLVAGKEWQQNKDREPSDVDDEEVRPNAVANDGKGPDVTGRQSKDAEFPILKEAASGAKSNAVQKRPKPASGVVYISRIPPGMDVGALRSLLGRVGHIGRLWLRPESAEARKERRALGSSRGRGEFRDGWVEFPKRRIAKKAVALLNGRPMAGATRRGRWADDLWCLKLLRGYQWSDLVEETCAGARERTLRVKAEVAAARREKAFVEERVAMAKRIEKDDGEKEPVRYFRQKRAIRDRDWEEDVDERRARESLRRVDEELETGKAKAMDQELIGMLFKKRRTAKSRGETSR